jgi:hypothetical protein
LTFLLAISCVLDSKWVMWAHLKHLRFNSFPMIERNLQFNGFWPLQSPSKDLGLHWNSNSQNGSSLGSARVYSFTLFCTPRLPSWAATLQTPILVTNPRLGLRHREGAPTLYSFVFFTSCSHLNLSRSLGMH